MKTRILSLLVPLLVCAGQVHAQALGAHWVFDPVAFRSHQATQTDLNAFNDTGTKDAVDSLAASGIAKFDTTVAVPTAGWSAPPVGSGVDSVAVCRLFLYDSGLASVTLGRTSATAESVYIKTQVSVNGSDWFDCAIVPGGAPVLNAWSIVGTANPGVWAFTTSMNTGVSGKMWSLPIYSAQQAAGLKHGIDMSHVVEFPFVRWICSGSRTLNHSWKCQVGHLTGNSVKQPG